MRGQMSRNLQIYFCTGIYFFADCLAKRTLVPYSADIRQDIVAVKNGIAMQYNNGLAEGSVNKLKVIKRIMYGRNSFELLKAKVLLHVQFCCEIN